MKPPRSAALVARGAVASGLLLQALAQLCACTQDFSSFRFIEAEPARPRDAGTSDANKASLVELDGAMAPQERSDAAAIPVSSDKPADSGARDANTLAANDAASAIPQPLPATADAAQPAPDADEDAQVSASTSQCTEAWNAAHEPAGTCAGCACTQCENQVSGCLSRGTADERALCSAVLMCALANHCHDWDCYCTPVRCAMPSLPGDGPCSEQFAAAAGGHDFVSAVHRANDPNQPLIKAVRAIGCSVGVPWGSAGGAVAGNCVSECGQ